MIMFIFKCYMLVIFDTTFVCIYDTNINALQLKTTKNITIVEQIEFITYCSEGEYISWGMCGISEVRKDLQDLCLVRKSWRKSKEVETQSELGALSKPGQFYD